MMANASGSVWLLQAAVVLTALLVARLRPSWLYGMVVLAVPWRVPIFPNVEIATLVLIGATLGRAAEIHRTMCAAPYLAAATLALPLWSLASAAWAMQPAFVIAATAKWLVLWGAMALVASDTTLQPRQVVWIALAAMAPMALWGFAERMHWITPLGEPEMLRSRAIDLGFMVRGRALFWHPNRLSEFLEQLGLLLAACAGGGVLPAASTAGALLATFGVWGTDSKAGIATIVAGGILTLVLPRLSSVNLKRAVWIGGFSVLAAAGVVLWAYRAHGGIGSRSTVFQYAFELFTAHPLLGVGAGNWTLLVGQAPLTVSRFWFRSHAHSLPLQLTVELGMVGLVLGMMLFAVPLWIAWHRLALCTREWRAVTQGAMAAVLGLLAHNVVHYFLRDPVDGILTGSLLGLMVTVASRHAPPRSDP